MKFVDAADLFDGEPAALALLSTFGFDPDYFERRLLRCSALADARRIAVFMDAGQWHRLTLQDAPARLLNRRYLVVPVRPANGVFHPKLNLLLDADGGQVQCGSNNLTRAGYSSNMELLNRLRCETEHGDDTTRRLIHDAYGFFHKACDGAEPQSGALVRRWLGEVAAEMPWVKTPPDSTDSSAIRLLHTLNGGLWGQLEKLLADSPPHELMVISPFFDRDGELVRRVRQRWPDCRLELVAQQHTSTLPVEVVKALRPAVKLFELTDSSRKLHAKLVCWTTKNGTGCLVGSANFTTAAFDARNVETCLLVLDAGRLVEKLFDSQFAKQPISFDQFTPGTESEPEETTPPGLRVTSAVLSGDGELRVAYRHQLAPPPNAMKLGVRTPGEVHPRALFPLPVQAEGSKAVVPDSTVLRDTGGTLLAFVIADVGGRVEESPPVWVVQEARLTHEAAGAEAPSAESRVQESGEGLAEFLDELGKREGVSAVIDCLRRLTIRFHDGGFRGGRGFRLNLSDPFRPDVAPEWLTPTAASDDLTDALLHFADWHEVQRLERHARGGNINGMRNFLDILTALVRLLYVYHLRGAISWVVLMSRVSRYVHTATDVFESRSNTFAGYLYATAENLGDPTYLQSVCDEVNFLGQLRAALLIAQAVTSSQGKKGSQPPGSPTPAACLPQQQRRFAEALSLVKLKAPTRAQVTAALSEYRLFDQQELVKMGNWLGG